MPLTPIQKYQQDLQNSVISEDPAQLEVISQLQRVYEELVADKSKLEMSLLKKLFGGSQGDAGYVKGLYIWGGVGRGKTYLMDVFFECLPFEHKMRSHFHRFMRNIHQQLQLLKGQVDPLERVASQIAGRIKIICFDEFFISDITDAMLLGGLLGELFKRGVILVATSNVEPDRLYENGLQRDNFLPAIDLLKQHTETIYIDSSVDYRLRVLDKAELYHSPLGSSAEEVLLSNFLKLAPFPAESDIDPNALENLDRSIEIEGRTVAVRKEADDVIWFDFAAICDGPRSQNDYIELAREYHAVLISAVPVFTENNNDQARRFINLVDVLYDHNVKLVLSAAAELDELYQSGRLSFEFQRTQSRLIEMQSHEYLSRQHRP